MTKLVKILGFVCFSIFLVTGCGDGKPDHTGAVREANKTNVAKVRSCYVLFKERHGMKAPNSKEELVKFLNETTNISKNLDRMGVDQSDIEGIFISERDNEEVKVRWGVNGPAQGAIVFESVGVDGKRLIAGADVKEVEDQEYKDNWEGKVKPPTFGGGGGDTYDGFTKQN